MSDQEIPRAEADFSRPPVAQAPVESGAYQIIADKVGMVPNLRRSDNVFQAKFVGASALIFGIGFLFAPWFDDAAPWFLRLGLGVVAGLLGGLLVSGLILAIKNLVRK